jgi:hypothetical protein
MQYILEIVIEKKEATWECIDTIESDTAFPVPAVGDEILTPHGWVARVEHRQFWFTYLNRVPLVKIEIRCRRMTEAPGRSRQKTKAAGVTDREGDARE